MDLMKKPNGERNVTSTSTEVNEDPTVEQSQLNAEELQKRCRLLTTGLNDGRKANSHPRLFLLMHRMKFNSAMPMTVGKFALSSPPVMLSDLQSLFLYSIVGSQSSFKPRWCEIRPWRSVSQVVVITINLSRDNFLRNIDCFPYVTGNFQREANLQPCRFMEEFLEVPVNPIEQLKNDLIASNTPVDSICGCPSKSTCGCGDKPFPVPLKQQNGYSTSNKTRMLLSMLDMICDQYELPLSHPPEDAFVYSKEFYTKVSDISPVFSVDCEMCVTDFATHELTRISVVDEDLNVVLDTFVKPKNRITDYLTRYSGVTKKLLEGVETSLEDVQLALRRLLPSDAILCGHSLNFDLKAMRMYHPYVIDLSNLYNLSGDRKHKSSLQTLAFTFLGETIQDSTLGHCSVEDSVTAMKLLKLKMKQGMQFGNIVLGWQHPNGLPKVVSVTDMNISVGEKATEEELLRPMATVSPPVSNSIKKRKRTEMQLDQGVGQLLKHMKEDAEMANGRQSPAGDKIRLECGGCRTSFTSLCKNRTCLCLGLTRKTCSSCVKKLYERPVETASSDSANENSTASESENGAEVPVGADLRIPMADVFKVRHATTETLFHFMPKRGKKFEWIGAPCHDHLHSQCVDAAKGRCHHHFEDNRERVRKFRESLLENHLGLLNLSVSNRRDVDQLKEVDQLVQEVMISTAVKALVAVVFVPERYRPNTNGICFLTIKG